MYKDIDPLYRQDTIKFKIVLSAAITAGFRFLPKSILSGKLKKWDKSYSGYERGARAFPIYDFKSP
ncbi:MAG: hypothetical protein JRJ49_02145 [Deltaproteobacteria bacterium]|nr:hypothetical protein [Deltaproteobacteria bacterium]